MLFYVFNVFSRFFFKFSFHILCFLPFVCLCFFNTLSHQHPPNPTYLPPPSTLANNSNHSNYKQQKNRKSAQFSLFFNKKQVIRTKNILKKLKFNVTLMLKPTHTHPLPLMQTDHHPKKKKKYREENFQPFFLFFLVFPLYPFFLLLF